MSLHSLKVLYFIYLRSVRLAVIEVSAAHLWEWVVFMKTSLSAAHVSIIRGFAQYCALITFLNCFTASLDSLKGFAALTGTSGFNSQSGGAILQLSSVWMPSHPLSQQKLLFLLTYCKWWWRLWLQWNCIRCHLMWYCWTQFLFLPFLFLPHPELFNCHILALSTFYSVIRSRRCNYQQHCAQCKALVFKLRPILRFFALQGWHVAPMGVKFGKEEWRSTSLSSLCQI